MLDERDGLAVGIPQVIKTPEKWPSVVEMIQRSIRETPPVRPLEQDFETIEEFLETENEFIENLIDFKIEQCFKAERTLTQRTNDALNAALPSQDPAHWRELQNLLDEWFATGVRPVYLSLPDAERAA